MLPLCRQAHRHLPWAGDRLYGFAREFGASLLVAVSSTVTDWLPDGDGVSIGFAHPPDVHSKQRQCHSTRLPKRLPRERAPRTNHGTGVRANLVEKWFHVNILFSVNWRNRLRHAMRGDPHIGRALYKGFPVYGRARCCFGALCPSS